MKEVLISALLALGAVAWTEFREWFPWFAKRMIALAVAALSPEDRARMQEELSAEVAAVPGKLSPFFFACSLCWGFWRPLLAAKVDVSASRYAIRAADVVLSSLFLFLASPVMLSCMIAIKASGRGPLIFKTKKVGRNNKEFYLLTFRTWDIEARAETRFGAFLRTSGLAGLPNFIKVLEGDMSLVGPPPRRSTDGQHEFGDLRPGMVWFSDDAFDDATGFGRSTVTTMKQYVRLICRRVLALLIKD